MSGNPYLEGSILAENGLHGEGQEVASGMEIKSIIDNNEFNGNMVLNASGDGLGGAGQPLVVSASARHRAAWNPLRRTAGVASSRHAVASSA